MAVLRYLSPDGLGWLPVGGASTLDDLTDVDLSSAAPVDKGPLQWDAASSMWVPGAGQTIPGVLTAPWDSGTVEFRTNGSTVTMVLTNVQRPTAHTDGQSVICSYPAGVTPPWTTLPVAVNGLVVKSNGYLDPSYYHALVLARPDAVALGVPSNTADWPATSVVNASISWAR